MLSCARQTCDTAHRGARQRGTQHHPHISAGQHAAASVAGGQLVNEGVYVHRSTCGGAQHRRICSRQGSAFGRQFRRPQAGVVNGGTWFERRVGWCVGLATEPQPGVCLPLLDAGRCTQCCCCWHTPHHNLDHLSFAPPAGRRTHLHTNGSDLLPQHRHMRLLNSNIATCDSAPAPSAVGTMAHLAVAIAVLCVHMRRHD